MKPLHKHLKPIALFLAVIFMVQSCKVYRSKVSTVEEAIQNERVIKVKVNNKKTYEFKQLFMIGDTLYGSAKSNSYTAKILKDQIVSTANNPTYVQIMLSNKQIGEIHELNRTLTILLPIIIYVSMGIILGAIYPIGGFKV